MNRSTHTRRFPAAGPTPVGQRLRAATIQGRRAVGPTLADWADYDDEDDES